MKRYFIEDVQCGISEGGIGCGPISGNVMVTIKFRTDNKTQWLSVADTAGILNPYLTDKDIFDDLLKEDFEDEEFSEYLDKHFIEEFDGISLVSDYIDVYESIYSDPENPAAPLIKYLLLVAANAEDDVDEIIEMGIGKYADELDLPVSEFEEEYLEEQDEEEDNEVCESDSDDEDDSDEDETDSETIVDPEKESLYKLRLSLETDIVTPSVYHDLESGVLRMEKRQLKTVKGKCDEADYQAWKETYIARELKKLNGKKFLACEYLFAGIGQYEAVIPEEDKGELVSWINGNGSAFLGSEREATEEEIKRYIALQAAADKE